MKTVDRFEVVSTEGPLATYASFEEAADWAAILRDGGEVVRVQPEGDVGSMAIDVTVSADAAAAFLELVDANGGDVRAALERAIWSAHAHQAEDAARDAHVATAARQRLSEAM